MVNPHSATLRKNESIRLALFSITEVTNTMIRIYFQKQNVPKPVKMVAALHLVFAVVNLLGFIFFVATMPIAWFGIPKAILSVATAIGLLNLSNGWRTFSLIISGFAILIVPFEVLAMFLSSDFFLSVSKMTGIDSWVGIQFVLAFSFLAFLWIFITLMRPDVKRAFESGEPQSGKQETLAT
jgi:hypothetical protein